MKKSVTEARGADARVARAVLIASTLSVLAAFLVYSPSVGFEFLRYDDEIYIENNPHLRPFAPDTILRMFTESYYKSYIPLTLLSHAVDALVWGDDPRGHHLTNVILHALTTGLVLWFAFLLLSSVLRRPEGDADLRAGFAGAVITAFLFSFHPLRVESVAWVSDRKDLLLGFFLFASLLLYLLHALRRGSGREGRALRWSLVLFVLAVLSKTTAVVAPVVMLLMDAVLAPASFRGSLRALVREKTPFFIVAGLGAGAALLASEGVEYHYAVEHLGGLSMVLLPFYTAGFFLWKFLWPVSLTPVYCAPSPAVLGTVAVVIVALTAAVGGVWYRHGKPFAAAAWGAYLLLLAPTMAGVSAGIQPWADRYTYVPMIGLLLLAGGWAGSLWTRATGRSVRGLVLACGGLAVAACVTLTSLQLPLWRDSVTLWRHAEKHAPASGPLVLVPLGIAYNHAGMPDSAIRVYERAAVLEPRYAGTFFAMGEAYTALGRLGEAENAYREAIGRDSFHVSAWNNLADLALREGRTEEAIGTYRRLLRRHPENALVRNNLGYALMLSGDIESAEGEYLAAIRLRPGLKSPMVNLAVLFQNTGRPERAVEVLRSARSVYPHDASVNYNLGVALEAVRRFDEAETAYRTALVAKPLSVDAWINLGNLVARAGRLQEARAMYEQVTASIPRSPELPLNLAGIYRALGEKDMARGALEEALRRKPDYAPAAYALGLLHLEAGDSSAGREWLRSAAKNGSAEAERYLERLGASGGR